MDDQGAIEDESFFRELDRAYRQPGHLMRRKMELVSSLVWPGEWLLDVGCGTGEALIGLQDRFQHVVGLEASSSAVRYARKKAGDSDTVRLLQGSAYGLSFRSAVFDCCLLLDILEHLGQPRLALLQVARVLRGSGQLIVTVPNWTNWITARLLGLNPEHCTFHTPLGWKRLIEGTGFKVQFYRAVRLPFLRGDFWTRKLPYLGMCILLAAKRQPEG